MTTTTASRSEIDLRSPSRFVGGFRNKIDQKGRVSVPADFRRHLDLESEEPSPVLFCCPSLWEAELQCGGADLVDVLLEVVATQDVLEKKRAAMERAVTTFTERLYFDENGRVVLPRRLRDHARVDGYVSFAGAGPFFTMSAGESLDDLWALATDLSEEDKDILRARSMPSTLAKRARP